MKIKLKELNPNPFKKEINGGVLDENTIKKIQSNLNDLGLMGALPAFKKEGKYYLISGHHRKEALRREFGEDYEVEIVLHDYSDENILRGMVIENLTQRDNDFREEKDNILLIRKWLKKNVAVHRVNSQKSNPRPQNNPEPGSIRQIYDWLSKKGEVMSIGKIESVLCIADNLAPELLERVEKAQSKSLELRGTESIGVKDAIAISKIKDQDEQKQIADIILNSGEMDTHERIKLIGMYKDLDQTQKEEILSGKIHISELKQAQPEILSSTEMALAFHKRSAELIAEMRAFRTTLYQFRKSNAYESFTKKQRESFKTRIIHVKEEYGNLVNEILKSVGEL